VSARRVLVVEDDPAIRRGLVDALGFEGYAVEETGDGKQALALASAGDFDLVLLDLVLPGIDGLQVLDAIRRLKPALPVIMVTARGAESDRVRGLKTGADDYVVKPFSASELLARVAAVLRRSPARPERAASLTCDGLTIDLSRREVRPAAGDARVLSEKEAAILAYLAGCRDRAVSRDELLAQVWGLDPQGLDTRTVDMHVARLREKLAQHQDLIVTVRAKGYMLAQSVVVRDS
jgi:DNA-binding response OmpR family regulator